jgi:hypothetical protein
MHPEQREGSPSHRRRRFPRWLTVPGLVASLLFGSWATGQLPTSDSVTNAPFFRTSTTGQPVELRIGLVKVTQVRTAAEIQSGAQVAGTSGIWLVVDVDFTPKDKPQTLLAPQLSDSRKRNFGGLQVIVTSCGPGQPGLVLGCTFALEIPKDALQGAVLILFSERSLYDAPIDEADIDLGIDESRAEQLAADTGQITVEPARVKGKA